MDKKNILLIASDNSVTSGAFLCLVKQSEILRNVYHQNVLVVLPNPGDGEELLKEAGVPYVIIRSCTWTFPVEASVFEKMKQRVKVFLYNLPAIRQTRKLIRSEKIDLVHINTIWTYAGAIAALKEKTPLVWHIREALKDAQKREILFGKHGYRLMEKADRILTVSDFIADLFRPLIEKDMVAVYDGLDESLYYNQREILTGDTVQLTCIGLLAETKGQRTIIEACKLLKDRGILNVKVNLVGRSQENFADRLKEFVKDYSLEDMVCFPGATSYVQKYYNTTDIFIMSSTAEAFGRTTVEAMLGGCLVIGAAAGATTELLNHGACGRLYEYGNAAQLAEQIMAVMNNRDAARQMAKDGQAYALTRFTADANAQGILEHYREVLHG